MTDEQAERADLARDEFKDQLADDHAPEYDPELERWLSKDSAEGC